MTGESGSGTNRWCWICAALLCGVGVATTAIHGHHFITSNSPSAPAIVYSVVLPVCLSLTLIGAGWWLTRTTMADEHAMRITGWSIVGAVAFTIPSILLIRYQQLNGVTMSHEQYVLTNGITGGMTLGFAFGVYTTQLKRQTAQLDRYQHRLERERDRFVALFDNLPDPSVQYEFADETPIVRVVNPAFERIFDTDGTAVNGTPVDEVLVPSDQEQTSFDLTTTLRSDTMSQDTIRLKTAWGIRDFQLIVIPPPIATTETIGHIIAIDVTSSKQYMRRLEVLNRVLRHDLRNQASIIIGNSDLLIEELSDTKKAETIRKTAYQLVELGETVQEIEHALDRDSETNGTIAVLDVLERCVDRAHNEYPDADIQTTMPETDDLLVTVNKQIDAVFDNVIENAIEHNDAATPTVSITVTTDRCGFVTIEIADNGPGLPERERQVLEEGTETQLKHSLGLGLWVVNWLVIDSGGDVTFDDNDPRGSVVSIDLPTADNNDPTVVNKRTISIK